jgi:hypothetical protein
MSEQWIEKNGVKRPVYDNPGDFPADCMTDYESPEERIVWSTSEFVILPKTPARHKRVYTCWASGEDVKIATGSDALISGPLSKALEVTRRCGRDALLLLDSKCEIVEEWPIA